MGKIIAVLIVVSMLLVGCNTQNNNSEYYKEMSAIDVEFNGVIGFVTDTIKNETDNGNFNSKLDFAQMKLRELYRNVDAITPPDDIKEEHGYYSKLIKSAHKAIGMADAESYQKELKEGVRLKKLAQPLIDRFQGE